MLGTKTMRKPDPNFLIQAHTASAFSTPSRQWVFWLFYCSLAPPPKRVSMRRRREKINFRRFSFLSSCEGGLREENAVVFFPSEIMHIGNSLTYTLILNAHPHLIAYPPRKLQIGILPDLSTGNCQIVWFGNTGDYIYIYIHIFFLYKLFLPLFNVNIWFRS